MTKYASLQGDQRALQLDLYIYNLASNKQLKE